MNESSGVFLEARTYPARELRRVGHRINGGVKRLPRGTRKLKLSPRVVSRWSYRRKENRKG